MLMLTLEEPIQCEEKGPKSQKKSQIQVLFPLLGAPQEDQCTQL